MKRAMKRNWRFADPLLAVLLLLGLSTGSGAQGPDAIRQLKAAILASPSATQALAANCARLHLADPPVIRALRDRSMDRKADDGVRRLLQVKLGEPVRYRRVRLSCGDQVLSDADNWYVPARLTAQMNSALDSTDTSFGTVVKPLGFQRRTLGTEGLHDGRHVLRVRALLVNREGLPFSLVQENYSAILVRHP
jgi:chorismate-pyruvate lyase